MSGRSAHVRGNEYIIGVCAAALSYLCFQNTQSQVVLFKLSYPQIERKLQISGRGGVNLELKKWETQEAGGKCCSLYYYQHIILIATFQQ